MELGYKFKSALFGFSKKQVMGCIVELNQSHEEELKESAQKLSCAEAEKKDIGQQLSVAQAAVIELKRRMDEQSRKEKALEAVVKRLVENRTENENEISQLKQRIAGENNQLAELTLKNNELMRRLEESFRKVEKYDQLTRNISDVVLEAETVSLKLKEEAEKEASRIVSNAKKSTSQFYNEMDSYRERVGTVSTTLIDIVRHLQKEISEIDQLMEDVTKKPEDLESKASKKDSPSVFDVKPVQKNQTESAGSSGGNEAHSESGVVDFFGKFREWLK